MKMLKTTLTLAIALGALTSIQASELDQRTVFTFSNPVELPGTVLPAGTYVFKLLSSSSDRNVVQVFNENENQIFGTFLAITDYRVNPSPDTMISLEERAAGSPEAIKEWFYPGRNYGHEFVYPKQKVNQTPEFAIAEAFVDISGHPAAAPVAQVQSAPLPEAPPAKHESEVASAEAPIPVEAVEIETVSVDPPEQLPSTGSWMPTIGLLGLFSIGMAGTLRFAADRRK
jgi:hypothetical protein